jgi:hypothetical protein
MQANAFPHGLGQTRKSATLRERPIFHMMRRISLLLLRAKSFSSVPGAELTAAPAGLPVSTFLGHSVFPLGMALLPHLEGLFQASAWYDGSTSTAMIKEI